MLVERHVGSRRVKRFLGELFERGRRPGIIRSDNVREFIAGDLQSWLREQGVASAFTEKGRPQQNGLVERFNVLTRSPSLRSMSMIRWHARP